MIYAKNNQKPQAGLDFRDQFTYKLNKGIVAYKLTLNVRTEEDSEGKLLYGPAIVQVTESEEYVFEDPTYTEQFLELGFWSKSFATPITGWRIKVPEGLALPCLVDIVAYG
jgi:hypothetical protein